MTHQPKPPTMHDWVPPQPPTDGFFGVDRGPTQTAREAMASLPRHVPPTWRERLYRAWRALLGDWD